MGKQDHVNKYDKNIVAKAETGKMCVSLSTQPGTPLRDNTPQTTLATGSFE